MLTLREAFLTQIDRKRADGKTSSVKKLEACLAQAEAFPTQTSHDQAFLIVPVKHQEAGAPLPSPENSFAQIPLAQVDADLVGRFSEWLTDERHLTPNTRATYLRTMHAVCRAAAKEGAAVDLSAFPKDSRANAARVTREETGNREPETGDRRKFGLSATRQCWYAMKCRGIGTAEMEAVLRDEWPGTETFRTEVTRMVATRHGNHSMAVELLRRILFFRTTPAEAQRIKFAHHDRVYIYDYKDGDSRRLAEVSAHDLKVFMYMHSIAPDRILYYFPDETGAEADNRPEPGDEVEITEGAFKGLRATVTRQSQRNPLEAELAVRFPLLNLHVTAPVPWRFLRPLHP